MNIVIFSKDRALQLELLIRSMKKYFVDFDQYVIQVLYAASNSEYNAGYDYLKKIHPEIKYLKETNFKRDLLDLVDERKYFTLFFVDDLIFKNPFTMKSPQIQTFRESRDIACLSLRLHPRLTWCYSMNKPMKKPSHMPDNVWLWGGNDGDYSYTMSVDGHIFKTDDIFCKLSKYNYNSPNTLEGQLATYIIQKSKMMCFEKSVIFNNPFNKVQKDLNNKSQDISTLYLNGMFLTGYVIDLKPYHDLENESVHKEVDIRLIKNIYNT